MALFGRKSANAGAGIAGRQVEAVGLVSDIIGVAMRRSGAVMGEWVRRLALCVFLAVAADVSPAQASEAKFDVFFDFGSVALSPRAKQTLDALIAHYGSAPSRCVAPLINVHLDSAEAAAAIPDLELRRAEAVKRYMESMGVVLGPYGVGVFGASRPLVATAPNVREPQNRRVEIRKFWPDEARIENRPHQFGGPCTYMCAYRVLLRDGTLCHDSHPR